MQFWACLMGKQGRAGGDSQQDSYSHTTVSLLAQVVGAALLLLFLASCAGV